MSEETYIYALDAALKEREAVLAQLEELEKRAARLNETIATLLRLINDDDNDPTALEFSAPARDAEKGLTDKVRDVLKAADAPLAPTEVKDGLIRMGVDTQSYSNVMASIHTILKRLVISKEVEESKDEGKTSYRWKAQRPNWFDRISEQFADDIVNAAKRTAPPAQPSGLKVQPRPTRVRTSGIEPRPQKTEEGQKLPTYNPPKKAEGESLPRLKPELLEAMKKKEDK